MFEMPKETISAIVRDIRLAQGVFGEANVFWPPTLSWLKIVNFRLPPYFNRPTTDLLIIPPPYYGFLSMPLEEFYMDQGLLVYTKSGWQKMPHYHTGQYNKFGREGWSWYCIHPKDWKKTDSILTFLKLIELMLQNPLNWRP